MKRLIIILFGFLPILCAGCHSQASPATDVSHLVTEISVTRLSDHRTHRYSEQKSMGLILNYIRRLDPYGKADGAPVGSGDDYQITLLFSDGRQRIYLQKAGEYFLDESNQWKQIHPEDARHLSLLFAAIPSDEKTAVSQT